MSVVEKNLWVRGSLRNKTKNSNQGCQIFLGTAYQNGTRYTKKTAKLTKWPCNIPTSSRYCKTLQILPKSGFLVWKYAIWQPYFQLLYNPWYCASFQETPKQMRDDKILFDHTLSESINTNNLGSYFWKIIFEKNIPMSNLIIQSVADTFFLSLYTSPDHKKHFRTNWFRTKSFVLRENSKKGKIDDRKSLKVSVLFVRFLQKYPPLTRYHIGQIIQKFIFQNFNKV
jgi:hypothetical protein